MDRFKQLLPFARNATQLVATVYQAVVILAFVLIPIWAYGFFQLPFIGVLMEHTMVTNSVGPSPAPPNWTLYREGLRFGNQLLAMQLLDENGTVVEEVQPFSYNDYQSFLSKRFPGENVRLVFARQDGMQVTYNIPLTNFTTKDQVQFFWVSYLIGFIYLGVSLWIFGFRRSESAGRAFAILATSVAMVSGGLFDLYSTHYLTHIWSFSVPMVGAALINLALVFPQEPRLVVRYPNLRLIGYPVALFLHYFISRPTLFNFDTPTAYAEAWRYSYIFTGISILFFLGMSLYRRYGSASPVIRQQARIILIGTLASFAPITAWLLLSPLIVVTFDPYIFFMPLVIFPLATGYTVLRYRLVRTDYILGRGLLYSILTLLAIGGYFLLAVGFSLTLGTVIASNSPLLIAGSVIISVLLFNPVRIRLQEIIDSIFFRGDRAYQERMKAFTRELTRAVSQDEVIRTLRSQISMSLLPSQLHIYVYDPLNGQFIPTLDEVGQPTSDLQFMQNSALPAMLMKQRVPLFMDDRGLPSEISAERGRLALLGSQLFVPMPGRERLIGWIALGERLSGENYGPQDISFLEALSSQAAIALERAQVVNNMQRRVNEMNALARISQGINITLDFNDILELIYAQTSQIIPLNDFHLTLYNRTNRSYVHAFAVEDEERLLNQENIPLAAKSSLEQEVIIGRRSILTQDYQLQCQSMGISSPTKGIYAWMAVPLNTGSETLGALSIASRDTSINYTEAQLELLQSIADQAAGAIVKARLLQETERRAQQLSILNVITRQLTSTLDLQPLLKNILENATEIINTEAGSLFLLDPQTDELVFEVTVGPVASNLVGQRLPAGTGFVGKAVTNRAPVIVNDVQATTTWSSSADQQTGFITQSILAVPLEVKDRVIGVIEIINKKDGTPFTEDDQNLLAAFGGQAAVAIENARLYTLTDQELAARVEELSVMQRIDRELNTSLEVDRAMRITLEWAMRQSRADAGFIGFVQEKGIELVAHQGLELQLEPYQDEYIPSSHPALDEVIFGGQARHLTESVEFSLSGVTFLPNAQSQISIPIRREAKVIGIMLLETRQNDGFAQDALAFLSRLADHAAIAISNAQLYAEVEAANVAKSEFVSFVAHELKNPMTSIKGYSELLAAGAVGPISDMQSNFLTTIRSNIERMRTIVEDLNDNSKIEAGRMRLEFKAVDVAELVDDAIKSIRRQVEDKKQTINVSVPANLPAIWADRTRVSQVLVNLISNAFKYTPEGGTIAVNAEKTDNIWDPQGAGQVVHIWVQDSGIGIAPEDQKKIFQKFFRSEDEQARKSPGTGLGLNITRSLVEMQGGKIWFESEFRKGTTFHFTVPVSEN